MNAVLKPFFPKTTESKFRVSSNEGNLLWSEKTKKENQYRFTLAGMCKVSHFKPYHALVTIM